MAVPGSLRVSGLFTRLGLQTGDLVTARIKSVLSNGKYRLILNRHIVTARSNLVFKEGEQIRARFARGRNGVYLHLLEPKSEIAHPNFAGRSAGAILSAALIRAGLSLPDDIEGARRAALLKRTKGIRRRIARLYAELLAAGADPNAGFLEMVNKAFSEGGSKRQGGWPIPPESRQLSDEFCGTDTDVDPLLDILACDGGRKDGWRFTRLKKILGDREIRMMWKIRKGIYPALALTIQDGKRIFEFLLEGLEETRMAVFSDSGAEIDIGLWNSFRKSLASLGIKVDDTILDLRDSDGFTPENLVPAGSLEKN